MSQEKKYKNPHSEAFDAYRIDSGNNTGYGVQEWSVITAGLGQFGHYTANQDKGKWILHTPGSSVENVGGALKAKGNEGNTSQRAKEIFAQHGDIVLEAPDGEIILKAKNVRIVADGGGDDGDFTVNANHIINVKSGHDIRFIADNTLVASSVNTLNLTTEGFFGLSYTYALSGGDSDLVGTIGKFLGGIFKLPGLPG